MTDYLLTSDEPLLRTRGFTPGFSGQSWFGVDKFGVQWQAYVVDGDERLTFVNGDDRLSQYLTRDKFEELFK